MKITPKILSIPPYISTSWVQIHALYMRDKNLIICLADGATVTIPELSKQDIEAIFNAHSTFTENSKPGASQEQPIQFLQNTPNSRLAASHPAQNSEGMTAMHLNFDSMESFSSALQHNSEQAHMPRLPSEVLNKIAAIAKIIAPGDIQNMPKPEPHCNCPHCQIARAIHGQTEEKQEPIAHETKEDEEMISENDLSFQQWEISQTGDKLYSVANRLDLQEKYNVFLGDPVGCTCGTSGCEHILAVLKS